MDGSQRTQKPADTEDTDSSPFLVGMYETRPGRLVFTERNNSDGWIATDLAVELVR